MIVPVEIDCFIKNKAVNKKQLPIVLTTSK